MLIKIDIYLNCTVHDRELVECAHNKCTITYLYCRYIKYGNPMTAAQLGGHPSAIFNISNQRNILGHFVKCIGSLLSEWENEGVSGLGDMFGSFWFLPRIFRRIFTVQLFCTWHYTVTSISSLDAKDFFLR